MNVEELKKTDRILFETVAGSHAYGFATPSSDKDIRGVFYHSPEAHLKIANPPNQINDEKHDIVFYSLKRFFELAKTANPNIIELFWMPKDVVIHEDRLWGLITANRLLFITKKVYFSHSAYAAAQIKKARGQNKMVNNPMPKERPKKEDFVWVIDEFHGYEGGIDPKEDPAIFPSRPVPLTKVGIDLREYHVASLEHAPNVYRLYYYGDKARGVFRGDDMLVCESVPIDDEFNNFSGLMIYNQEAYEKAVKDWKKYWDWMENRNKARWIDQEKGKLNYDQKNMTHCLRLMYSAKNILEHHRPIVRFEGEQLKKLKSIRAGELEFEEILEEVSSLEKELQKLYEKSTLPNHVNDKAVDDLYKKFYSEWIYI